MRSSSQLPLGLRARKRRVKRGSGGANKKRNPILDVKKKRGEFGSQDLV